MNPRRLAASAAALAAVLAVPSPAPAAGRDDGEVVLRRAAGLEEIVGRVRVRQTYGPRVDVPVACDDGEMRCSETRRFEQALAVEFALERREDRGGEALAAEDPAGTLYLAAALDDEAFDRFRARMDRALRALSAEAFSNPLAGIDARDAPFDAETLARADADAWMCADLPGGRTAWRLERRERVDESGRVTQVMLGATGYSDADIAGPVCDGLARAVRGAHPEEFRTLTVPTLLLVQEVRVFEAIDLPAEAWPDQLAALPEGSWRVRRAAPGQSGGTSWGRDDESGDMTASRVADEVREVAKVAAARIPARTLDGPSWVQRWTAERGVRRLGERPRDASVDRFDVLVAWIPIAPAPEDPDPDADPDAPPPRAASDASGPFAIRADREAMLDEVARRLRDLGSPTADDLDRAVTERPSGLASDGWMFVVCRPDGVVAWGLPPTEARAPVVDGAAVCSEIAARVP